MKTFNFADTVDVLMAGKPAIYPTDTVVGVGLAVKKAASPEILYQMKERPHSNPIAWLVSEADAINEYGKNVPEYAYVLFRAFSPGPITVVVEASDKVPQAYASEKGTIGLRVPDCATTVSLMDAVASPLATTSANFSGQAEPRSLDELDEKFAEEVGCVLQDDVYDAMSGIASTVVDCTGERPVILREGPISADDIEQMLM